MFVITGASEKLEARQRRNYFRMEKSARYWTRRNASGTIHTEGREAFVADVTDAGALKKAFSGAKRCTQ